MWGGLDNVINSFNIGKIIMPNVTHTTKTFEDVLIATQKKGLKITTPKVGDEYELGDAKFTILGPNQSSYSNLNDYSVATKLEFGNNSFIFTGDAEVQAEKEIVSNGLNIEVDVLSVGHHGSETSTIQSFLDKVNPTYAVIQVGKGNQYNHPDNVIISRLENKNIKIYRNDIHGNIVAIGDGEKLSFETGVARDKSVKTSKEPENENEISNEKYIGNRNSKIFHKPNCSSLPNEKNRAYFISREEVLGEGYRACKRCNP